MEVKPSELRASVVHHGEFVCKASKGRLDVGASIGSRSLGPRRSLGRKAPARPACSHLTEASTVSRRLRIFTASLAQPSRPDGASPDFSHRLADFCRHAQSAVRGVLRLRSTREQRQAGGWIEGNATPTYVHTRISLRPNMKSTCEAGDLSWALRMAS